MSARLLGIAFTCKMGSRAKKLVLLKLVDCCNDDGDRIFPSIRTIAKAAECSDRTAQRVIAEFVSAGLLKITKLGGKGRGSVTEYALDLSALREIESLGDNGWEQWQTPRKGGAVSPLGEAGKGDTDGASRVTPVTRKGDTACHPTPYRTPQVDPLEGESAQARQRAALHPHSIDDLDFEAWDPPPSERQKREALKRAFDAGSERAALVRQFREEVWPGCSRDGEAPLPAFVAFGMLGEADRAAVVSVAPVYRLRCQVETDKDRTYRKSLEAQIKQRFWLGFDVKPEDRDTADRLAQHEAVNRVGEPQLWAECLGLVDKEAQARLLAMEPRSWQFNKQLVAEARVRTRAAPQAKVAAQ